MTANMPTVIALALVIVLTITFQGPERQDAFTVEMILL
jgi:hypothetical protein